MSCIVADSGPLIALAGADLLHLPAALYGRAMLPRSVFDECVQLHWRVDAVRIQRAVTEGMLDVCPDVEIPEVLRDVLLDAGELSAMALAMEQMAALLIDELRGRRKASELGLPVVGLCGLLLLAKREGLLPRIGPELLRIRSSGYYLSDALIQRVLELANE